MHCLEFGCLLIRLLDGRHRERLSILYPLHPTIQQELDYYRAGPQCYRHSKLFVISSPRDHREGWVKRTVPSSMPNDGHVFVVFGVVTGLSSDSNRHWILARCSSGAAWPCPFTKVTIFIVFGWLGMSTPNSLLSDRCYHRLVKTTCGNSHP
jgi:hypothetical protein